MILMSGCDLILKFIVKLLGSCFSLRFAFLYLICCRFSQIINLCLNRTLKLKELFLNLLVHPKFFLLTLLCLLLMHLLQLFSDCL